MGKVINLCRRLGYDNWDVLVRVKTGRLAMEGRVEVHDPKLAEAVWQATHQWDELYVLHGDLRTWTFVVERAIDEEDVG